MKPRRTTRGNGRLPEILRPLFWQYRFDDLKLDEHRELVLLHVVTNRGPSHIAWLRRRIGDGAIPAWIRGRKARGLMVGQVARWGPPETVRRWHRADPNSITWEARLPEPVPAAPRGRCVFRPP